MYLIGSAISKSGSKSSCYLLMCLILEILPANRPQFPMNPEPILGWRSYPRFVGTPLFHSMTHDGLSNARVNFFLPSEYSEQICSILDVTVCSISTPLNPRPRGLSASYMRRRRHVPFIHTPSSTIRGISISDPIVKYVIS